MENKPEKKIRKFEGVVVSDKMDKTIVVKVDRFEKDSKYNKYHRFSKKFKAHDAENAYKTGDKVVIEETRPISKDKRWVVTGKIV
ncbi:MAG: 30S ribosomal protein S17 [Candidatus Colwellbacteria bacterium]|nr:30S ribosomal protein S17 [Candidatus Colwellbacteria bacterium]